ncbi:MAG: hypothetical protein QGH39_00195 [Candidatus Thermoplasmatota archaeon]|nr:hypothetical protein [Candidatus Thermoplasmatota archaeon]MDP7263961.1 hypothetical protein [Candidatus Thermoplasmatota archaeon]
MNLWVSSSALADLTLRCVSRKQVSIETKQESASSSPPPPNGGAYPMDTIVSEETVKVPVHEFRRGFLRM